MRIIIEIDTSDACFWDEDGRLTGEFGRILAKTGEAMSGSKPSIDFQGPLFSIDGNKVGKITLEEN